MSAAISSEAVAAIRAFVLGVIPNCTGCGSVHDADAKCADIAASLRRAQAVAAADADLIDRAQDLLAAHRDAVLRARAFARKPHLWRAFDRAAEEVLAAIGALRMAVAIERDLWDGIAPADVPLMTVDALIVEFWIGGAA